jgi:peroxiredoxin
MAQVRKVEEALEKVERKVFKEYDQATLLVLAPIIGRVCTTQNRRFIECKAKTENPADCIEPGIAVQRCVNSVLVLLD